MATEILLPYTRSLADLCGADMLLFRAESAVSREIQAVGRSRYNHVGTVGWARGCCGALWLPYCIDTLEGRGGAALPLLHVLQTYPGSIDVYEPNPDGRWDEYTRDGAERWAWENIPGRPYGRRSIWRFAVRHTPGLRWLFKPSQNDGKPIDGNPVCSSARSMADRIGGGVDPVPNFADEEVEPGDLARSPFYRYKFTLARDNEAELQEGRK